MYDLLIVGATILATAATVAAMVASCIHYFIVAYRRVESGERSADEIVQVPLCQLRVTNVFKGIKRFN